MKQRHSAIEVSEDLARRRPWAGAGEFFVAVHKAAPGMTGYVDPRLLAGATGLNQQIPSEGGFLVAPEIASTIWDEMNADRLALLPRTDSYTVTGESAILPANAETSRVQGSLYGGLRAYWISEADQITKSKPTFRQIRLEPQSCAVLAYGTEKLLANAGPVLEQYLTRAAAAAITHLVNQAIVEGTGAGQPKGLLTSGSVVSVAKESGQAAASVLPENVAKMWARLHPIARENAVWLYHSSVEPALDTLATVVKNSSSENVGGYAAKVFDPELRTLKGRPILPCDFCAVLGTVGDLILVDLKSYATATRGTIETALSMHVRFDYAESAFRFMFAVDGQTWLQSAITPAKGSDTLSTVVTLATRS